MSNGTVSAISTIRASLVPRDRPRAHAGRELDERPESGNGPYVAVSQRRRPLASRLPQRTRRGARGSSRVWIRVLGVRSDRRARRCDPACSHPPSRRRPPAAAGSALAHPGEPDRSARDYRSSLGMRGGRGVLRCNVAVLRLGALGSSRRTFSRLSTSRARTTTTAGTRPRTRTPSASLPISYSTCSTISSGRSLEKSMVSISRASSGRACDRRSSFEPRRTCTSAQAGELRADLPACAREYPPTLFDRISLAMLAKSVLGKRGSTLVSRFLRLVRHESPEMRRST